VSRMHAVLEWHGARAFLCDQHSTNGTLVNGERISQPRELQAGDRVLFGQNGPEVIFPDAFPCRAAKPAEQPKETAAYQTELRKNINDTIVRINTAMRQSRVALPANAVPRPTRRTVVICRHFRQLAQLSVRSAVCEAWRVLEEALRHRYQQMVGRRPPAGAVCVYDIINALHDRKILSRPDVDVLHDMRDLRNKAAHSTVFVLPREKTEAYASQALQYVRGISPAALQGLHEAILRYAPGAE